MDIEQFNPAECRFKFRNKNIAYLSARNTRDLAMNLGVESDGTKLQVYERIVSHLEESGADAVISEVPQAKVLEVVQEVLKSASQEPAEPKKPARKATRKPARRRKATFL